MKLEPKRILLICPRFYSYSDLIVNCLADLGYNVTFFENRMLPSDTKCSTNIMTSYLYKIKRPKEKEQYINEIIKKTQNQRFDILLSINAFIITEGFINSIKKLNPQIKTILFLWDSLIYWKYANVLRLFDKVYSFDHNDCDKYNLTYHPDFIIGSRQETKSENHYKIVHIGSVSIFSSHRIPILAKLKRLCKKQKIPNYITIVTNIGEDWEKSKIKTVYRCLTSRLHMILLWRYIRYKNSGIFTDKRLSLDEVNQIEYNAELIIDIPPLKQNGCTIRSLEALNRGQKILTTNESIVTDEFYDGDMIHILNNNKYDINKILAYPNKRIDLSKLLLKNWCASILNSI